MGSTIHRIKKTFTSGELSPRVGARLDFERYKTGCKVLKNMTCQVQGPATRRPGTKFIHDLSAPAMGLDTSNPLVREIPFIYSEAQAYALVFYMHTDGDVRMVIGINDILVVGTGSTYSYDLTDTIDYTDHTDSPYSFEYPSAYTINSNEVVLIKKGVETILTETTDYTVSASGGVYDVTVTNTSTADEIRLTLNLTIPAVTLGDVVVLTMPSGFDIEEFDYAQSLDELYIVQGNMRPFIIIRHDHEHWAHANLTFGCFPDAWPHDPITSLEPVNADYDAIENWPETVTFHGQRLTFGGNSIRRQTIWQSAAGDYLNMGGLDGGCSGIGAADGLSYRLDSGTQNRIKWLASSKVLCVGTMGNEWTVRGAGQTAITPSSLLAQLQTNIGSEKIKPLMVGLSTLFVERHGRTINEFKYEYTTDSYETSDRSVLSTHLTDYYSITAWCFQQMPDQVIWAIRADGNLLGCTYQREHKVVGWHEHDTQGEFKAITSIPGANRNDEVWVVVKREVDGSDVFYLERMEDEFLAENASDGRFLDSHLVLTPSGTTVSGLDHLEGLEVDILADGTVHPSQTVSGGAIELDDTYTEVVVGLGYTSEVRPYLQEVPMKDGTSFGRTQRILELEIDFYKTLGCQAGRYDRENGETVEVLPFRVPADNMGEELPLYTGIYNYDYMEGFDRDAEYFIRQEDPLPLTVRGVVDKIEVS